MWTLVVARAAASNGIAPPNGGIRSQVSPASANSSPSTTNRLELMAGLQEDLQFVPPRGDVLDDRIPAIFDQIGRSSSAPLDGSPASATTPLKTALQSQRNEIERYSAHSQEFSRPRLSAWLSEVA